MYEANSHLQILRRRSSSLCRLRRRQPIEAEAVTPVGEAVDTTEHRRYRAQACAPRYHEHDEDLVFDRFCRGYPAEDLPGHHAGQRDDAGCRHRIDDGHQRAAERLTRHRRHGLPPGGAEHELSFHTRTSTDEARRQGVETNAMPVMQLPKIMPRSGTA